MNVSKRLLAVPASPIRKLVPLAQAAKKSGVKVYHLNIGDPDIKTPTVMMNVLKHWNSILSYRKHSLALILAGLDFPLSSKTGRHLQSLILSII